MRTRRVGTAFSSRADLAGTCDSPLLTPEAQLSLPSREKEVMELSPGRLWVPLVCERRKFWFLTLHEWQPLIWHLGRRFPPWLLDSSNLKGRRRDSFLCPRSIRVFLWLQQVLFWEQGTYTSCCSPKDPYHRRGVPPSRFKCASTEERALWMVKS